MQAVCGAWRVGRARAMGDRVRIVLDRAGLKMSVSREQRRGLCSLVPTNHACGDRMRGSFAPTRRAGRACAVTMKQRTRVDEILLGLQERKNVSERWLVLKDHDAAQTGG